MSIEEHPLRSIDWCSRAQVAEAEVEELRAEVEALKSQKRSWWAKLWGRGGDFGVVDSKTGNPFIRLGKAVVVDGQVKGEINQSYILRLEKRTTVTFSANWACQTKDMKSSPTLYLRSVGDESSLVDAHVRDRPSIVETVDLPAGDYEVYSYYTGDGTPHASLLEAKK